MALLLIITLAVPAARLRLVEVFCSLHQGVKMFLIPLLVLIGLLIVAKLVTPIIAGLAVGIFVIMLICNLAEGPFPTQADPYQDDY